MWVNKIMKKQKVLKTSIAIELSPNLYASLCPTIREDKVYWFARIQTNAKITDDYICQARYSTNREGVIILEELIIKTMLRYKKDIEQYINMGENEFHDIINKIKDFRPTYFLNNSLFLIDFDREIYLPIYNIVCCKNR
jgi:hypothetical protein